MPIVLALLADKGTNERLPSELLRLPSRAPLFRDIYVIFPDAPAGMVVQGEEEERRDLWREFC